MLEQSPSTSSHDSVSTLLSEFYTRLNEVEEKQRLLRDRALLIGENLISSKEDFDKENFEIKKQINSLGNEIKNLKQTQQRILNELSNFTRKTEFDILKRQFDMFQPLELARIKDVENIIENKLKNKKP